jgi:hypothetical protein
MPQRRSGRHRHRRRLPSRPNEVRVPENVYYRSGFPRELDTSQESWTSLRDSGQLSEMRALVLGFIRNNQDHPDYQEMITEQDIADAFGGDSSRTARPRVAELRHAGAIVCVGYKWYEGHRRWQYGYRTTGTVLPTDQRPVRVAYKTVLKQMINRLRQISLRASSRVLQSDLNSVIRIGTNRLGDDDVGTPPIPGTIRND